MQALYPCVAAFGLALYFALQTGLSAALNLAMLALMLIVSLVAAVLSKRERWRNAFLVVFFVLLGMLNGLRVGASVSAQLQPYFGKEVVLCGHIEALQSKERQEYVSCIMQCEKLQYGQQVMAYKGRVRLALPQQRSGHVVVRGRLEPLHSLRNPGCFDGALYNRINSIGGRLTKAQLVPSAEQGQAAPASSLWQQLELQLAEWNLALRHALQNSMGKQAGALLGSMLLGGISSLDEEMREIFAANGLAHLLSVSGTHLVLLAGLLASLLKPLPPLWRRLVLTLCLSVYALLCGLRPPVLRALLMSTVLLWGREAACASGKQSHYPQAERGYLLCIVALVLLLFKPLWLLDLGFQLSFGAAAGLIWLLPACTRRLISIVPEFLAEPLAVTMAAQLATLPILVANFHQLSLISIASNVLLLPVLELAVLLAVLGTVLANLPLAILVSFGDMLLHSASFLLAQLLQQGSYLASLPYSQLVIGSLPLWCAVAYYALLLLWADIPTLQFWSNRERHWLMTALCSALTCALLWQRYAPQPVQTYFLDVGQGDCVVVTAKKFTKRMVVVYDTGGLPNYDTGKQVVAPFLRYLGEGSIDVLILSHYDYDHVGGALGLLEQCKVRELLLPQEALDATSLPLYEAITKAAARRGTHISVAQQGRSWLLGEGAVLSLVVPADLAQHYAQVTQYTQTVDSGDEQNQQAPPSLAGNDASTVLTLRSPRGSLLLTGDLGSEGEQELELGQFDVFKAGHHGSKHSNSEAFLQHIQPQIIVVSCARNNRYGHPHAEAIERFEAVGSKIYRTDVQGCIKLSFDESGIKCYSYTYEDKKQEVHSWK